MTSKRTTESCQRIRARLVHYLEGTLDDRQTAIIAKHVESCKDCRFELDLLRQTLELVEADTAPPELDPAFRQALRSRLLGLYQLQNAPGFIMRHGIHTVWKAFGPTVLGVATSMLSFWPIFMGSLNLRFSPFGLLMCGMIWCGLYNALFFMYDRQELEKALGREPDEEVNIRIILMGTLACLVFLMLSSLVSVQAHKLLPHVVLPAFWEAPSRFLGYFSAVAVFLASLGVGRMVVVNPMGNMFLICGVYCMLVFPSFFITSVRSFSLPMTLTTVSTVFGAGWLGCCIGVFLRRLELQRRTHDLREEDETAVRSA